jgi:hypothetical protein
MYSSAIFSLLCLSLILYQRQLTVHQNPSSLYHYFTPLLWGIVFFMMERRWKWCMPLQVSHKNLPALPFPAICPSQSWTVLMMTRAVCWRQQTVHQLGFLNVCVNSAGAVCDWKNSKLFISHNPWQDMCV